MTSLPAALVAVGEAVREDVLAACRAQSVVELAAYDDSGDGDTQFAVDKVSEQRLLALCEPVARLLGAPLLLVAEGLGRVVVGHGEPAWTLLVDPLDGTRPLAHQKRSAWFLAGLAPGTTATLADLVVSVMVEVPTVKAGWADVLVAEAGRSTIATRVDLRTGARAPFALHPSRANGLEQGYGGVARYFPGARAELAEIDDEVHRRILGRARAGKAQAFEDQYCTGGTMAELAYGHDRWAADLRPLLGDRAGICAHPYDLAGWLVPAGAGVHVVHPDGGPLRAPLDLVADVAWAAYANDAVRAMVEPHLQAVLRERGLA